MTLLLVIAGSLGLSIVMMAAWAVQKWIGNAGWVDAVWSFGTGTAGAVYALMPAPGIDWPGPRQFVVAALVILWSVRLGSHIAARVAHGPEDSRYARFRREWGASFQRHMFWFLQVQAGAAAFLALSVLAAARNPTPLGDGDCAGIVVLVVALAGEAIADVQLRRFRRDPAHRGRICDRGLWHWSRHPNYFFEWLGWLAYPLLAIDPAGGYGWGWFALSAPAFMYYLLVHVSGVPPLEQQMLCSRGDAYRAYQARTHAFWPWPKFS